MKMSKRNLVVGLTAVLFMSSVVVHATPQMVLDLADALEKIAKEKGYGKICEGSPVITAAGIECEGASDALLGPIEFIKILARSWTIPGEAFHYPGSRFAFIAYRRDGYLIWLPGAGESRDIYELRHKGVVITGDQLNGPVREAHDLIKRRAIEKELRDRLGRVLPKAGAVSFD